MKPSSDRLVKRNTVIFAAIAVIVLSAVAFFVFWSDLAQIPVEAIGGTGKIAGADGTSAAGSGETPAAGAGADASAGTTTETGTGASSGVGSGVSAGSGEAKASGAGGATGTEPRVFGVSQNAGILTTSIPDAAWSRDVAAAGYKDGAPIGGLGAGTVTWQYDGNFYYDRLVIGQNERETEPNCGFYMYQQPSGDKAVAFKLDAKSLKAGQAAYHSLFPKSWVDYYGDKFACKARVTQFSPVIPEDYMLSSYPAGVYMWELSNPTQEKCDVSIMFTWRNGFGGEAVTPVKDKNGRFEGIKLVSERNLCEFSIGCETLEGMKVTYSSSKDLKKLRSDFSEDGSLNNKTGNDQTGALCVTAALEPGEVMSFPMVLAWDMPIYEGNEGNDWYREYTRYFGRDGNNSWKIAMEALDNAELWEAKLDNWQSSILNNSKYPDWLKTTLFNELYYYTVGGTVWEAGAASGQKDEPNEDMFGSLECFEYPFYGTADVRFYGSWALAQLWPEIDKQCVRQFCDSVYNTRSDRPKSIGTTAHDFGMSGNVFSEWNGYTFRDSTNWRDLNTKLVLMVYRDWALTGKTDKDFLNYCWIPVQKAMEKVKSQDDDGDGLPNSNGVDQTYDDMSLTGNTAYCGGLFLAACEAAEEMALAMGEDKLASTYGAWLEQGRKSYEKELWNGKYYNIDTDSGETSRIMSDQLCGQWYAVACGLPGIVPDEHAASAFNMIYQNNFKKFDNGAHGIVNVMKPDGKTDTSSGQTQECWVGTSWCVAAGMIQQGMTKQAGEIGQSLYNTIWDGSQLWFRTPEAWYRGADYFRAQYYMRATAVWALKHAYDLQSGPAAN